MKQRLRDFGLIAFGFLLYGVVLTGIGAYRQYVLYSHADRVRPWPDPVAVARLGKSEVPVICMTIGRQWTPEREGVYPSWIRALGYVGDKRAVPTLIALTDHPNSAVRCEALDALGKMADNRALPAIRRLTRDGDNRVRDVAESALENLEVQQEHRKEPQK